jgi:DNA-binding transcriptional MerR regulator
MKYGQVETQKLYFSSNEAAELVGVPVDVLLSWEKQHSNLKPEKNRAGKRTYRPADIEIAKLIKEEKNGETLFKDQKTEAKEAKEAKKSSSKSKNRQYSKDSLLKVRDSLQSVLRRIKD